VSGDGPRQNLVELSAGGLIALIGSLAEAAEAGLFGCAGWARLPVYIINSLIVLVCPGRIASRSFQCAVKRQEGSLRLADEYDAAQERGEVRNNGERTFSSPEKVGPSDIGLTPKEVHEPRQIRDAERADPGIVSRTLNGRVERGEEPTKAALRQAVVEAGRPKTLPDGNKPTAEDIGLTSKQVHEARQIWDAERGAGRRRSVGLL
jgi:hypothetical protein